MAPHRRRTGLTGCRQYQLNRFGVKLDGMGVPTTPAESARFRQGAGRLCLDFLRTLRFRGTTEPTEELVDPAALAAWISQCGRTDPQDLPSLGDVSEARALREAVHELLTAARTPAGAGSCRSAARELVNRAAARP